MKKGILIGAFCLLLGMVLVSGSALAAEEAAAPETAKTEETVTVKADAQADAALEAEVAKIFGQNEWITTGDSFEAGFSPSTSWVCNQGAYCTYRNDPACGPEGFCNLPTNCCMCY